MERPRDGCVREAAAHLREAQEALDAAVPAAPDAGQFWEAVATTGGDSSRYDEVVVTAGASR